MIGAAAAVLSALALVDPRLRGLIWAGLFLAALALLRDRKRVFLPVLALLLALPFFMGFSIGADSMDYYAYTSSLLGDGDLDFSNQWSRLGFPPQPRTATGLSPNVMPAGPGLLWAPAVFVAHLWLTVTGGPTDPLRLSPSYYSAAVVATLAVLLAAVLALGRALAARFGGAEGWLAVLSVVLASPLLFYATVQPLMSHAFTFAFASACVALTLRAERERSISLWAWCGASLGLAMLCRAQTVALLMILIAGLWRARAGWKTVLVVGITAFLCFAPQLLTWKALYGSFVTIPQGNNFIDWSGSHTLDVLISADRGLFNWHPLLLFGLSGLIFAMKGHGAYAVSALAVFAFTAFLNGSVTDWNGSGAFGARRFDPALPLLALGMAALLSRLRPLLARRPLLLPALGLALAVAWNISLIDLVRGRPATAIPLDDLARRQALQARRALDASVGRMGPSARDAIYRAFVGLFAYLNHRPGGRFDLAILDSRFLRPGWSEVQRWDDGSAFRYLLFPGACISIPLDEPLDLHGFVRARSPARIRDQRLTLTLNGRWLSTAALPADWTDIPFEAPRRFWQRGENEFCMTAARKRPGDEGDDQAFAAAVIRVQLP